MSQKYFKQTERIILVAGASVHSFVSPLFQRELRVSKFGLKCMKVCMISVQENVGLCLMLRSLETSVPLAGGHLKPGLIVDMETTSVGLISEWACCQISQLPKMTFWFLKTVEAAS